MKKRTLLLAVLAVVLVLSSGIGSAIAYFTTYATARGGYVIHLGDRTEIEEQWDQGQKIVRISNVAQPGTENGQYPVFVRARAFYDSELTVSYSSDPEGAWQEDGAYWYYQTALYTGDTSGSLKIRVLAKENEKIRPGETADVIVVYESVPAVFTAEGKPDLDTAWKTGDIRVINP
jgi:hypothetical protein